MSERPTSSDGVVPDAGRVADRMAIEDLVTAYAYAVDDRDWVRWEGLFLPDGHVDYTAAGGIAGTPAEVAAWMPDALAVFTFCLHTTSTHEIRFVSDDEATGRVHVFNRNGVEWEGEAEILDVGAVYEDVYCRVETGWRIARRIERITYMIGGKFADVVRAGLPPADG